MPLRSAAFSVAELPLVMRRCLARHGSTVIVIAGARRCDHAGADDGADDQCRYGEKQSPHLDGSLFLLWPVGTVAAATLTRIGCHRNLFSKPSQLGDRGA